MFTATTFLETMSSNEHIPVLDPNELLDTSCTHYQHYEHLVWEATSNATDLTVLQRLGRWSWWVPCPSTQGIFQALSVSGEMIKFYNIIPLSLLYQRSWIWYVWILPLCRLTFNPNIRRPLIGLATDGLRSYIQFRQVIKANLVFQKTLYSLNGPILIGAPLG